MFYKNCGTEGKEGAQFCPKCETKTEGQNKDSKKESRSVRRKIQWKKIVLVVGIALIMIVYLCLFSGFGKIMIVTPINISIVREENNIVEKLIVLKGVRNIEKSAFSNWDKLTEVILPEGLESIGYHAFEGCGNLREIILPEGLEGIGYCAFYDCGNLREITLPEGLEHRRKSIW